MFLFVTIVGILLLWLFIFLIIRLINPPHIQPEKRAGRFGELIAIDGIRRILREGDHYFSNVNIDYKGRQTELDNVIVNRYGVFIIEVKNYSGKLSGDEDDYTWYKKKRTRRGNIYISEVKNPLKQIKRQIYILSHHLKSNGVYVWVEGYAFMIQGESAVESEQVLTDIEQINEAIHTFTRFKLSKKKVARINKILERCAR